ncbi:MAG: flavin reductase [Clostridia bacterium]|nr:flavin reductase [Clostridia bacterium]
MSEFVEIKPEDIGNAVSLIGKDWMLVTAGNISDGFNTMTASWGTMGVLWNRPVCVCYIRPQRYTYLFTEANEYITMCFFDESKRDALRFCGSHSGKDFDKIKECSLTPISVSDNKAVIFGEAKLALVCRKLYISDIKKEGFIDKSLLSNYPEDDFHREYVCEIAKVLTRK